ncbi:hypothetical protein MTTB_11520 [Methanothermobacter tenebrarum]|uniref:Uncharacterized protein n=1 Tax=Methanothermobacter tenebrarum TaxID=680118 RepID=A0ABM7YC97_9EURY|nr:hypothetical protein MTTB_11520 [Methanothermobacter tenebrarum]
MDVPSVVADTSSTLIRRGGDRRVKGRVVL